MTDTDRLLMPAFSTAKVRDMFGDMTDIASQMLTKWEKSATLGGTGCMRSMTLIVTCRFGPRHVIDPSEDFTRLAFDTITLCAMSYRCVLAAREIYARGNAHFVFRFVCSLNTFYSVGALPFSY